MCSGVSATSLSSQQADLTFQWGSTPGAPMTGLKPAKRVSYTFDMGDAGDMDPHYLRKTAMAEHQGAVPFDRMNIM
jgi:hypothetical protein